MMRNTSGVLKEVMLTLREHIGSSVGFFCGVHVANFCTFMCCVVLIVCFVLCLCVANVASCVSGLSIQSPLLPSIFCNVY